MYFLNFGMLSDLRLNLDISVSHSIIVFPFIFSCFNSSCIFENFFFFVFFLRWSCEYLNALFELFTYLKVDLKQHSVRFNYQGFTEHKSYRIGDGK